MVNISPRPASRYEPQLPRPHSTHGPEGKFPLVDQAPARGDEGPSATPAAISLEAAFRLAPPDGLARFPARRAGRIGPRLGDEAGVLARALAGPRALGVALGLDEGLFLVLRRLENAAPPGEGGSPVWHALLLWIPGGRRRGSVPRPDPRGPGHVKSILDANPIWQGHYTPKAKRAQKSPTPCTRVSKMKNLCKNLLLLSLLALMPLTSCQGNTSSSTSSTLPGSSVSSSSSRSEETGITLTEYRLTLYIGDTYTLTPTLHGLSGSVTYLSKNTAICSVDAGGVISALSLGTTIVKVSLGDWSALCQVSVIAKSNDGASALTLSLSDSDITLYQGESYVLAPTLRKDGATLEGSYSYASSDETFLSISSSGVMSSILAFTPIEVA